MSEKDDLNCSFCGKGQKEVKKLIAGPSIYICNECVDLCAEIIEDEKGEQIAPEELEYMGIRDYFEDNCCCFIEWPEKGHGILAQADIIINLTYVDEQRTISLESTTAKGRELLTALPNFISKAIPALPNPLIQTPMLKHKDV
jgi:hypothetical protein